MQTFYNSNMLIKKLYADIIKLWYTSQGTIQNKYQHLVLGLVILLHYLKPWSTFKHIKQLSSELGSHHTV